jgi:hypothetical protein
MKKIDKKTRIVVEYMLHLYLEKLYNNLAKKERLIIYRLSKKIRRYKK